MTASAIKPRFFAPEVVQTSEMDCGPASLKCILEGLGVSVSYGRLREACQTEVDGTSIDVLEAVANQLGLEAEQTIVPLDHLLLEQTDAFSAILVVRNPDGQPHFVVAWRRHGSLVQVMDPAAGRRWVAASDLLSTTHVHAMPISAETWRDWAGSDVFLAGLRARQRKLGAATEGTALIEHAVQDPSWRSLAALDAATRLVDALVRAGAIDAGPDAARILRASTEDARSELESGSSATSIPLAYWSAAPAPLEDGEERVLLSGVVLVTMRRRTRSAVEGSATIPLSPELAAALNEPPVRPLRDLVRLLREDGILTPALVAGAVIVATLGAGLEGLVLRGALDVGRRLVTPEQRVAGMTALVVFLLCLLGIEVPLVAGTLSMGRRLETRLRMAFLAKIPRLGDRYLHSRPTSDMTHRAHAIHVVRRLPALGFRLFRSGAELAVTTAGLVWLDPTSAPIVLGAAALSVLIPWATQSSLIERDLRVRAYHGALSRFYFDALLGLMAVRTHGADRSVRREHETMMVEFRRAFVGLLARSVTVDALDAILGVAVAVWLLFHYLGAGRDPTAALLLVYWALNVPAVGQDIAQSMREYPVFRNLTMRLVEPLGALEDVEDKDASSESAPTASPSRGVDLQLVAVTVRAAGKTILDQIDLGVSAGSHVAIVGSSGAGKSSLVGLLLGWHRAAEGRVLVDGVPLVGERLDRLRLETAWVDPAVQLWNRSLLENLQYGAPPEGSDLAQVLEVSDVGRILDRLPNGLATSLGDSGALVSGGEGQRVRLARAMLRPKSRLVILDEPFRGLDRERRRTLLERARSLWSEATLLCVTHDVGDTLDFPRVIVVDDGHVVEDGAPRELAAQEGSRFRALLDAEHMVARGLWRDPVWRRLVMRDGKLEETQANAEGQP